MDALLYQIALTLIPKVGPVTARNLLSYAGSAEAVFRSSKKQLGKIPGIGPGLSTSILSGEALKAAEEELKQIRRQEITPVFFGSPLYPERLKHFPDSPLMLYFKGQADLNPPRTLAIIGTRKPSPYGMAFCEEFLEGLHSFSPTIISGLAYGIDICAHRSALNLGLPTIGILAHGLGHLYPPAHRQVAQRMLENGGLLTEYAYNTGPEKEHFPIRNRIVAALCDALIVVETGLEGGSMITAYFANEYNKDVFAVPGRIRDSLSAGCNALIKTNRAALLESPSDLVQALRWDEQDRQKTIQRQLFVDLSPEEKKIVDLMRQPEEVSIDQLSIVSGHAPGYLASLLLDLEFRGVIRSVPWKRYALLVG